MLMDFSLIFSFFTQGAVEVMTILFAAGGWVILVCMLFYSGFYFLYMYKAKVYSKDWNYILLAIDVPQENIQTPKAVEQLFSHIFSVYDSPSIGSYYRRGFVQHKFSFEIISIGGYIQFLVQVLDKYRDVIEAAVYAQYPDAEITEVEDYTTDIPDHYPNDTHKMWASDFNLTQHYSQPIRMYSEFEHSISKDTVFKDPMGTFLESFSRIGPGEQMWFQIIIEPLAEKKWKKECIEKIKEMIGEKTGGGGGLLSALTSNALTKEIGKSFEEINAQITGSIRADGGDSGSDDGEKNNILYMTPGQKTLLESMENKISKIGFKTKIRAIYVAEKDKYKPSKGVNSLVGAINQFNNPSSNSLLPKYMTSVEYFFQDYRSNYRRNLLMNAYKNRKRYVGLQPFVLNIEELATIWHFPMSYVKTPMLQKAEVKRVEPPTGLPIEHVVPVVDKGNEEEAKKKKIGDYTTDSGESLNDDGFKFG